MRSIDVLRRAETFVDPEVLAVFVPTELAMRLGALSSLWPGDYASPTHQEISMRHLNRMIERAQLAVVRDVRKAFE